MLKSLTSLTRISGLVLSGVLLLGAESTFAATAEECGEYYDDFQAFLAKRYVDDSEYCRKTSEGYPEENLESCINAQAERYVLNLETSETHRENCKKDAQPPLYDPNDPSTDSSR